MTRVYTHIPVRLSHILGYCAVGSIIRGPEFLVTPKDTREWNDRSGNTGAKQIPYVNQIRSALGITQELREPPIARELENGEADGICIPARRFPSWMRCPKCGLLYCSPWRHQQQVKFHCNQCDTKAALEQVPWVFVSPEGHMADVPWHRLAHSKPRGQNQKQCAHDWNTPYLRLVEQKRIKQFALQCTRCRAVFSDFQAGLRHPYGNLRRQPWINESANESAKESQEEGEVQESSNEEKKEQSTYYQCSRRTPVRLV